MKSASEIIPKQKLGEDFVTDFVILNILDQGPVYTLVELEKSSHPILTQDNVLTSNVNHAVRQTRDLRRGTPLNNSIDMERGCVLEKGLCRD